MSEGPLIQGLKVTVPGHEVQRLLTKKAEHHRARAQHYQEELTRYEAAGIKRQEERMSSTSSDDPVAKTEKKVQHHTEMEREYLFWAQWTNVAATFELGKDDLYRMGVLESRY